MTDETKSKGTILVVDDEPDVLFFISKVFQPQGYHTIIANSGIQALKYLHELPGKIDLVLLDLRMPEMGGLQVLKTIRSDYGALPVIILTGYGEDREKVENLGIEGFMTKPYSLEELYKKVASILKDRESDKAVVEVPQGMIPTAKILVVDDEPDVCDLLKEELERMNDAVFEVRTTKSGEDALRAAQEFEPDIAIIDIKMTHMWGDELIERFKKGEAPCPKDFIIFTAVDDPKKREKVMEMGYKFIAKPRQWENLLSTIKKSCITHGLVKKKV